MNKFQISENISTFGLRESDDLQIIKESIAVNELLFMHQVHSIDILDARTEDNYEQLASGNVSVDGVVLSRRKLSEVGLVVKTADCVPFFIFDENYCVGIHAGWKGLADGIHFRLLDFFSKTDMANFNVIIGPHAINGYEVKSDVLEKFKDPIYIEDKDKTFLNMQETLCNDLVKMGIKSKSIKRSNLCTITNTKFYSYRRNKLEKKRNLNIFSIK